LGERTLLIRADAGAAMGTGHVMRCLALAQAWQGAGGQCVFAMAESTPALERRLRAEGMERQQLTAAAGTAEDATQTQHLAGEKCAAWIVVDGYQFGSEYQLSIKSAGFKLLFVDDNIHAENYSADLVLNQNLHATVNLYAKSEPYTRLLLGPRYAMLRRDFLGWRNWRREIPAIGGKILVTMGGSDPNNLTTRVIEAIRQLPNPNLETVVLLGGSNPHLRSVQAARGESQQSMRLITDATNMAEWMAWADVAVAGAGTTFWEMCFLGLPGILLVLAENQRGVAAAAEKMGIAYSLGEAAEVSAPAIGGRLSELLNSHDKRKSQSEKGRTLVDGRGAERVVAFLSGLELRRTVESDCEVFWEWANDPEARAASFHREPISWEAHAEWFRARLSDPKAIFYTATNQEGLPVGQVRYQIEGKRAVLSVSLGVRFRRCGWGRKILGVATERLFQESEVEAIDAYVKPTNEASIKLFTGTGFVRLPAEKIEGQEGVHFILHRSLVA
jgi:UDP-2,4-diacetamido-2,4,6-trideoxy-beta-L-altropyranose hydrolase